MSTNISPAEAAFNRDINFWGRITMAIGLVIVIGGPLYIMFSRGLTPGWDVFLTAFGGLAAVFAVNWIVEPLTYFPMLGVAGTYQAWLVGNISNKLLPAAITAQASLDVRPGTRKGELAAISAISGAVIVHVCGMLLLVAIGGTYIVSILPERLVDAFDFILPAILGAVIMQLCVTLKSIVMTLVSAAFAALMIFVVLPLLPSISSVAMLITIILAVTVSILILRKRKDAFVDAEATEFTEA